MLIDINMADIRSKIVLTRDAQKVLSSLSDIVLWPSTFALICFNTLAKEL